jgi:DNA-binding NarL/FixJ family response regulator
MVKRSKAPDIVIVDILMPNKDGYQTIVEIKEILPDARIIAISGGGDIDPKVILDISSIIGADRILSKPFIPDDLRSAVDHCLE